MAPLQQMLGFYSKAKTYHQVESDFVKQLLHAILDKERLYYAFSAIERVRNQLLHNKSLIEVNDLGAGSKTKTGKHRSIKSIAQSAVSPEWQCAQLFRLIEHMQAKNRLELGTSLGIASLYQYFPIQKTPFYTLEGCPNIAAEAAKNFERLKAHNIRLKVGDFADTLVPTLKAMQQVDYLYIDGNHREDATLQYFERCLPFCHSKTVIILDDIYWSSGMRNAWKAVKKHPKVALSIDLYYMGMLLLDAEDSQQKHYNIISEHWKPWLKRKS